MLIIIFCIGLPIAFIVRRFSSRSPVALLPGTS
jgi:hypothetical protein